MFPAELSSGHGRERQGTAGSRGSEHGGASQFGLVAAGGAAPGRVRFTWWRCWVRQGGGGRSRGRQGGRGSRGGRCRGGRPEHSLQGAAPAWPDAGVPKEEDIQELIT